MTHTNRLPIPGTPISTQASPEAYAAFARYLALPDTSGIGAWTGDPEILRLACLEKLRRDGPRARAGRGFVVSFIGLGSGAPAWADGRVQFWDEGLGPGWNLYVFGHHPFALLNIVEAGFGPPCIFTAYPLPARLPGYRCELTEDYSWCLEDTTTPPLTQTETERWLACAPAEFR
jgi:hypothetical protein